MLARLQANWVYGGALAGVLLLALAPVLAAGWGRAATLGYLALPVYMLHQLEEHDDDRFRRFVNQILGKGRDLLTLQAVFWINILGVWGLLGLGLWLIRLQGPGWAALAGWLVLVNGLLHLGQGLALRRYNPGLVTGVLLFLPLGGMTLAAAWPLASGPVFWGGFAIALAVHIAIVLHVRSRLKPASGGVRIH